MAAIGELSRYAKHTSGQDPSLRSPIAFSIALMAESTAATAGNTSQRKDTAEVGAAQVSPAQSFAQKWIMVMAKWIREESVHFPTSESVALRRKWATLIIINASRACAGLLKLKPQLERVQVRDVISSLLVLQSWAGKLQEDTGEDGEGEERSSWASLFGMVDEALCSLLQLEPSEEILLNVVLGNKRDERQTNSSTAKRKPIEAKVGEASAVEESTGLLSSLGAAAATLVGGDERGAEGENVPHVRPAHASVGDSLLFYLNSRVIAERERSSRSFHLLMKRWNGLRVPAPGALLGVIIPRCAEANAKVRVHALAGVEHIMSKTAEGNSAPWKTLLLGDEASARLEGLRELCKAVVGFGAGPSALYNRSLTQSTPLQGQHPLHRPNPSVHPNAPPIIGPRLWLGERVV